MTSKGGASPVMVGLADDHPVVLRGLEQLLAGSRFRILWKTASRRAFVQACRDHPPEIIVLDLRLGEDLAPDAIREIRGYGVAARIIVMTGHDDRELLRACVEAGVAGVLFKDSVGELDFVRSLERVANGATAFDPRLSGGVCDDVRALAAEGLSMLTAREYDVLRLLAQGMSSRGIASELSLSVNTVRSYVQSTLSKLDAHSRIQAVHRARQLRIL